MILSGQESASTNFWVFTPEIFPLLEAGFRTFLADLPSQPDPGTKEFLIPSEVNHYVAQGEGRVWVLRTRDTFFGLTQPQEWEWVVGSIRELIEEGQYPEKLWGEAGTSA